MTKQLAVFIDFENIAIWAGQQFIDFDLTRLLEYLRGRGPLAMIRAYADWSRFVTYRDDLLGNAVDLVQLYSVRAGKNRADIHLALDAMEVALTREHIDTVVIVSGDSDFGPLANRLREYGRRVVGIGPSAITHSLLVRSCDEFIFLETVLGGVVEELEEVGVGRERARQLLLRALAARGRVADLPVDAAVLRETILSLDATFNEANLGYAQFQTWLEDCEDLVELTWQDERLKVAPRDSEQASAAEHAEGESGKPVQSPAFAQRATPEEHLKALFNRRIPGDVSTRRHVLADIYRELVQKPGEQTADEMLRALQAGYEARGLMHSRDMLIKIWQMALRQRAFQFTADENPFRSPAELAPEIDSETAFIHRAEADFVHAVVKAGLPVKREEMAALLLDDRDDVEGIQRLLDDLEARDVIERVNGDYRIAGQHVGLLEENEHIRVLVEKVKRVQLPDDYPRGVQAAHHLSRRGMGHRRARDFSASARDFLAASRIQWDAVEAGVAGASVEDLRWYLASYASVKAGELSQVDRHYGASQAYYLAFFALVQEDDPLWDQMRGLINPMLKYYWLNAGRETGILLRKTDSPVELALEIATHPEEDLRRRWQEMTQRLARINPDVLRRVVEQLRLVEIDDSSDAIQSQVAEEIEEMVTG